MAKDVCHYTDVNIPWEDVQLFLAIAETGSLSRAARSLGLTQPTISRRLAELEERVGEPLFERAVSGAKLSAFGERLVEPARRMAEWAGELERTLDKAEKKPAGVVRVTALPGLAYDFLAPFAAWLKTKQPDIRLEVKSTIQYLDLARRDADLALRTDRAASKDLVILAEVKTTVGAFASPEYRAKLPPRPRLDQVDWIAWTAPFDGMSPNRELSALIPGFAPVFASDDFLVQLRAARAGLGAIILGRAKHRFSGEDGLEELDIDLGPIAASLFLVSTKSALAIPRVRVVAELLTEEMKRTDTRSARERATGDKRRTGRPLRSTRS